MPALTRSTRADYDTTSAIKPATIVDLKATADIAGAGIPCTVVAGGIRPASAADTLHGWSSREALIGEPVTLYCAPMRFYYTDAAQTPGTSLYLTATAGQLSTDVPGSGRTTPVAFVVTANDIMTGGVL